MREFSAESALAECAVHALHEIGYDVFQEVPLMSRCVDLIAVHRETGDVMGIECKLDDWRRAIVQAQHHTIACDMVSICLPSRRPTDALVGRCQDSGIGLLMVSGSDGSLEHAIEPRRTERIWGPARQWLERELRERGSGSNE